MTFITPKHTLLKENLNKIHEIQNQAEIKGETFRKLHL